MQRLMIAQLWSDKRPYKRGCFWDSKSGAVSGVMKAKDLCFFQRASTQSVRHIENLTLNKRLFNMPKFKHSASQADKELFEKVLSEVIPIERRSRVGPYQKL